MEHSLSIQELLEQTGALRKGHFQLSSGLHSDTYIQCARILQYPRYARFLGKQIAELWHGSYVDLVVSPALGGLLIGFAAAEAFECRMIFTERVSGVMQLRRSFELSPEDTAIVVEDVVTTGGSAKETVEMLEKEGVNVVGVASIIDRTSGEDHSLNLRALLRIDIPSYAKEACPLCAQGVPVDSPGSRRTT